MENIKIVAVPDEEKISRPERPIELDKYPDINPEIAWELANLIRIAGTDYQCFNDWFNNKEGCKEFTLEEGRKLKGIKSNNSWIYTEKKINETTLEEYTLLNEQESSDENVANQFSDDDFYKYKIIKTYEYVSYYPTKKDVDIDRFGFIAERQEGDKKIVFVVFRGTREPAEWFSNAQFKQVEFLKTEEDNPNGTKNSKGIKGYGKISLGFNKMYTYFRPGIFIEKKFLNSIFRSIDSKVRKRLEKINDFDIGQKSIYKAISEYFSSPNLDTNAHIYVTGHSLGGALATIAAMDIAQKDKLRTPINLYTFASPRVGDNEFADKFNQFASGDNKKIKAFRFANSEDIVPKVPFPVWFKSGIDLEDKPVLKLVRNGFNGITGDIFDKDYQHIGVSIYFTHQARRFNDDGTLKPTATVGDNHNMTSTYCGALEKK
ncbi:MAG: lipase family protein [Xenococcaceae cyanobacterium MO_234.B1]|nr:lipase family protein [Xenococcaceae cyanobacterium MO_234.B1]